MSHLIEINTMDGRPCGIMDVSDPSKIQFEFNDTAGGMLVSNFIYDGRRLHGGDIQVWGSDVELYMRKTLKGRLKSFLLWLAAHL